MSRFLHYLIICFSFFLLFSAAAPASNSLKTTNQKSGSNSKSKNPPANTQQAKVIKAQRYQILEKAIGSSPSIGEKWAVRSEPTPLLKLHQKLMAGTVTSTERAGASGGRETILDWPATLYDMVENGYGKTQLRMHEWIPLPDNKYTKLGRVNSQVDVTASADAIITNNPVYGLLSNNCRQFVSKLWESIKA